MDFFSELHPLPLSVALNGETAYEFNPEDVFGTRRSLHCQPRWVVFLERDPNARFSLTRVSAESAVMRWEQSLPPDCPEGLKPRRLAVEALSKCDCFELRSSESPVEVAEALLNRVQTWMATSAG